MTSKNMVPVIISMCLLITACSNPYCPESKVRDSMQEIGLMITRFDTYQNTNFDINQMQIIRNELLSLNVPVCLSKTKNYTVTAMDYMIQGTRGFINNESGWMNHINDGLNMITTAENEMARVYACMPDCKP